MESKEKFYMNPLTGSVDTWEGWKSDSERAYAEGGEALWGWPDGMTPATFDAEECGLIEVEQDIDGDWAEVE